MNAKEVLKPIQTHMSLATYPMTASGNVATKSRSFFRCGKGFFGRHCLVRADFRESGEKGAIDGAGIV